MSIPVDHLFMFAIPGVLADHYVHDIDPFVFRLGYIQPRWYGVAYLLGFLVAYLLMKRLSREGMLRLHPDRVADLVLNSCIFGVLVGGRLGFALFYDLPHSLRHGLTPMLWDFSSDFPFWSVLRVWDGGMAAHGGILFTLLALLWLSRRYRVAFANLADAACMAVPLGLFFGRIANFINGELYGRPTTMPWGVKFPSEIYAPTNGISTVAREKLLDLQRAVAEFLWTPGGDGRFAELTPAQVKNFIDHHRFDQDFYPALLEQVGPINLQDAGQLSRIKEFIGQHLQANPSGLLPADIGDWWMSSGGAAGGLKAVMADWFQTILPARHPSQIYQALLEGLVLFVLCWAIGRLWRRDGMASGAFLTCYPIVRIIGEQFRVGDTPIVILGMEISKGALYSYPMFVIGAAYWIYWIRRNRAPGWTPRADPDGSGDRPSRPPPGSRAT